MRATSALVGSPRDRIDIEILTSKMSVDIQDSLFPPDTPRKGTAFPPRCKRALPGSNLVPEVQVYITWANFKIRWFRKNGHFICCFISSWYIFHRFLLDFCCLLQEPTSKKRAPTQCFVRFSHNSAYGFLRACSIQKAYQKPFQNEAWTLPKSMSTMCRFSTSIFSGFGLDFGGVVASNLEPSWLKIATNH